MTTLIGRGTFIRGRILGATDIEIQGRIEGNLEASGEVLIDTEALIAADIEAERIVVRGAVRGNLIARASLVLEDGARVVGDLRAPSIGIAENALVRGYVETAASAIAAPPARVAAQRTQAPVRTQPAARIEPRPQPVVRAPEPRPAPAPVAKLVERPAPPPRAPEPPPSSSSLSADKNKAAPRAKAAPPPPVVPVIAKGVRAAKKAKRA